MGEFALGLSYCVLYKAHVKKIASPDSSRIPLSEMHSEKRLVW